jgi:hypothetical protein
MTCFKTKIDAGRMISKTVILTMRLHNVNTKALNRREDRKTDNMFLPFRLLLLAIIS